ncbi:hypothetical protein PUNSTDRAFT_141587 [Punctularia strigosozonata HHB-11173 SS5]|uniref:uncharacterized protein n=1 Tax=Punctularia strigosozonata (strain HHB-11173) TaxID=741275 RepID=UPI00044181AF|nr:uncharacterized protein PUNSTDRAFT_141587 [Punctularia strigosozonata HHB-11173 SS5]EIN13085.1 hypothetical protein PUNSTDRAFT_141587 [Punctularia strigosozonata HHB-11173 SS5]
MRCEYSTARGENHLGTITLCLPSSFTGGDLVVRKGDREIVYDWSTDVWGASGNPQLPWAFLYADVEHEVLPVTSGMRVTAAWDVFTIPDSGTQISYDVLNSAAARTRDASKEYIRQAILAMFDDMSFVPEGAILGFGFSHSYPIEGQEWSKTSRQLKGTDAMLVDILERTGIKFEWRFRYDGDKKFETWYKGLSNYYRKRLPKIVVQPVVDHPFKLDEFTAKGPGNLRGRYVEGSVMDGLSDSGAKVRRDVMWVTYPGQSSRAGDYTAYGNEAETAFYYVAPCLFITLPPAEERLKEWHVVEAGQRAAKAKENAGVGSA